MDDKELTQMMSQIDEALGHHGAAGPAGTAAAIPNPCDAYNKIRNLLPALIALASKIPFVGSRIAAALTLLKTIGDQFCPTT